MISWPDLGTRVTVRYRRPAGSVPPLTDAVGHLLAIDPVVRVRTKAGAVVEFAPADAVALRVLTDAPVRTSQIRSLEHAVAAAWPGVEQTWLDGWLLRAGSGADFEANSAVPLDISARAAAIPAIVAWCEDRDLTPRLVLPDRLLRLPGDMTTERTERILVRDVGERHMAATLDDDRDATPTRPPVSDAPDGTRWVGLTDVHTAEAVLAWAAHRGATRAYLRAGDDDTHAIAMAESLGFRLHHRRRYVRPPDNL